MIEHSTWAAFESALDLALPEREGDRADDLVAAIARQRSRADVTKIDWEGGDLEELQALVGGSIDEEPLIVVTDLCYGSRFREPFAVAPRALAELCDDYRSACREIVFSGCDVIVVADNGALVLVAHHEGQVWLWRPR